MAHCSKCGNWLPDNANKCNVCGTAAGARQPQYQQPQYQQPQYQQPQYQQPQYQQPQYQQPQYQPPQYQPPQYPGNYGPSVELDPRSMRPVQEQFDPSVELDPRSMRPVQQTQYQPQPLQPPQPPREMPKQKKKKSAALVVLYILLGLAVAALVGLGGYFLWNHLRGDDPNVGMYEAVSCIVDEEEVALDGEWIELKHFGKATIHLAGETFGAKWERKGSKLTVTQDGDEFFGTVGGGELTLDLEGMLFTYRKVAEEEEEVPAQDDPEAPSGAQAPDTPEDPTTPETPADPSDPSAEPEVPTEPEAPTVPEETTVPSEAPVGLDWWNGDWYGWWVVSDGWGDLEEMESIAMDVCCQIRVNATTSSGTVTMWDDVKGLNQSRWEVRVNFREGYDDRGVMVSQSGTFKNGSVPEDDWNVDPTEFPYSDFENFICIKGTYQNAFDSSSGCEYYVFLRPWGTEWEDIRQGDMAQMPYTDMMPIRYDTWYKPLIDAGKGMPFYFNIG